MTNENKIKIYYDGLCYVCSKEMLHYSKMKESKNFEFIDITSPDFKCKEHGLDENLVHKSMHVKNLDGVVQTGIDAFIVIWNHIPQYTWLSKLAKWPIVNPIFKLGYCGFAALRPYLPKRAQSCQIKFDERK